MSTSLRDEDLPPVVAGDKWEQARQDLLADEKELTRHRAELAAKRRRMPMVKVEKDYRFIGPDGEVGLLEMFGGRRQLMIYRAFFQSDVDGWPTTACEGCSFLADHVPHLAHVQARELTFAFVSPADQDRIAALQERMDWHIPWFTLIGDDFDEDFGVAEYFGFNVFIRNDTDEVFRTYFINGRGAEEFTPTWFMLDRTPLGRQEEWEDSPDGRPQTPPYWWRLHTDY